MKNKRNTQNFRKKIDKFYRNLTYNPQNIMTFELVAICDIMLGSLEMQGNSKKKYDTEGQSHFTI